MKTRAIECALHDRGRGKVQQGGRASRRFDGPARHVTVSDDEERGLAIGLKDAIGLIINLCLSVRFVQASIPPLTSVRSAMTS